ncbi:MAG TPA: hypothetical protein VIY86_14685, partial [Pirellulaceae bacterium]
WRSDLPMLRQSSVMGATCRVLVLLGLLGSIHGTMWATTLSEGPGFDFSDDQNLPTLFPLTFGDNLLTASTGGPVLPGGGSTIGNDAEFVGVIVPAGMELDRVVLTAYQHPTQNNRVFIGYETGSVTLPHSITDYANGTVPELPNAFFGYPDVGLPLISQLGPGPFALWIQETNPDAATYTFNFMVIPEPQSWGLWGAVLALCGKRLVRPEFYPGRRAHQL